MLFSTLISCIIRSLCRLLFSLCCALFRAFVIKISWIQNSFFVHFCTILYTEHVKSRWKNNAKQHKEASLIIRFAYLREKKLYFRTMEEETLRSVEDYAVINARNADSCCFHILIRCFSLPFFTHVHLTIFIRNSSHASSDHSYVLLINSLSLYPIVISRVWWELFGFL